MQRVFHGPRQETEIGLALGWLHAGPAITVMQGLLRALVAQDERRPGRAAILGHVVGTEGPPSGIPRPVAESLLHLRARDEIGDPYSGQLVGLGLILDLGEDPDAPKALSIVPRSQQAFATVDLPPSPEILLKAVDHLAVAGLRHFRRGNDFPGGRLYTLAAKVRHLVVGPHAGEQLHDLMGNKF